MNDVVGSAAFELRATREKMKADLQAAEADLKGFGDKAEKDIGGSAGRIGGSIGRMASVASLAVAALVSVIGLAILGAFNLGRAGLKMAADIADGAKQIGVGTDALQEWRHVAQQTGAEAGDADKALAAFSKRFSESAAGMSREASKAFTAIGFSRDDLRRFASVEEALDATVDRIGSLSSAADRAAIAEKLGLGPLSAALVRGSDDIARMRDEAHKLGVVMDRDMIQRAAKAQQEFETLSRIIDVQLKTAFIDLAPVLNTAVGLIAEAARQLGLFVDRFRELENRTTNGLRSERSRLVAEQAAIADAFGTQPLDNRTVVSARLPGVEYDRANLSREAQRNAPRLPRLETRPGGNVFLPAGQHFDAVGARIAEIDGLLASRSESNAPAIRSGGGASLTLPPGRTPRERIDRSAEREARRAERIEQEIYRARQRLLDVSERDLLTAQERWDLAVDQLKMDRDARDAEIESKNARGEITNAERARLELAHEEADIVEDRILTDISLRNIRDEELANARILADLTANLVSLQIGAARTAGERQRLELELLAIVQKQRRDALDRQLNDTPNLSDADRQRAWDQNARVERAERDAVGRANMSPMERWRDQALKTADEVGEAFESIAARGLDSLNAGIVDAIMNSRSLGEVFSQVARQIMADLLAISVRRSITEPLANALFGDSGAKGGSSGGWLAGAASWLRGKIPGFSSGVTNFSGGLAYVHQGEVLANLAPGTDVIPAHAVGRGGGSGGDTYYFSGNLMTPEFWASVQGLSDQAYGRAVNDAPKVTMSQTARTQTHSVGRRRR